MYILYLAENNAMNFLLVERTSDFKSAILDWDLPEDEIDELCRAIALTDALPWIYDEEPWKDEIEQLVENAGLFNVRRVWQ